MQKEEILKHKSRRLSIKEGILSSANSSLGARYIPPFAIAINSSNSVVALLSSLGGLLGPLSQIFGSNLIGKQSRKKVVLKAVLFESLAWIPIIAIGIFFLLGVLVNFLPLMLLIFFSFHIISQWGHPAWFSWMGDITDKEYRGRWFSKRAIITGFVGVVFSIAAAFALDFFKNKGLIIFGFIILFFLAMVFRLIARANIKKQYEPKLKFKKRVYFSFWKFLRSLHKNNFGRFTLFKSFLYFSIFISNSLIAVYLLRVLNLSYALYILIMLSGAAISGLFLELWGKIADKYGNYMVIVITSLAIPLIPLLWILSSSPIYLILVPSTIGEMALSGFLLASGNFIYDNEEPQKRGQAVSYFNMVVGIGVFLGAGLGAILIKAIKINPIEPIFLIFIISSFLSMAVVSFFIPRIKEVRKVKKFSVGSFERAVVHEAIPTISEEIRQVLHMKKYFNK